MGRKRKPRRSPAQARIAARVEAMEGTQIAGGCDECNAHQTVEADPDRPGLTHLVTHHADTCSFLARYERRRS